MYLRLVLEKVLNSKYIFFLGSLVVAKQGNEDSCHLNMYSAKIMVLNAE